jgi:hypothetical protein
MKVLRVDVYIYIRNQGRKTNSQPNECLQEKAVTAPDAQGFDPAYLAKP